MYFIFFYLYGSHDQLEQRNDRVSALLSSKQRAPGRKGLHGDGAASGGRLRAAVVLSTQPEGDRSRTPSEATSNGDRGEPLVPPRTGSRRTLAYSSAGPSTAWNDADARLCAGSFQLDRRDARCALGRAALRVDPAKSSDFEGVWLPLHASSRLVASRQPRASIQLTAL